MGVRIVTLVVRMEREQERGKDWKIPQRKPGNALNVLTNHASDGYHFGDSERYSYRARSAATVCVFVCFLTHSLN